MIRIALSLALALTMAGAFAPAAVASAVSDAVGRINHSGFARARHCTFVALTPNAAVTADHCVAGVPPENLRLLYGYDRMGWAAEGSVRSVHAVGLDAAVLCLGEAAPATLDLGPAAQSNEDLVAFGYGVPRVHAQQQIGCSLMGKAGRRMILDCLIAWGASGGPVLRPDGRVAGIVTRAAEDFTLAVPIDEDALAVCQ